MAHDDATARPSEFTERGGLELRWPALVLDDPDPDPDALVVDVVNTGDARWLPAGASFHTIGGLTPRGGTERGIDFAFVGGPAGAVPLDPGESTRVPVHIADAQWTDVEPGAYEVRAAIPALGIRTGDALPVTITAEAAARRRSRSAGHRDPLARLRMLDTQIAADRARLVATQDLATLGAVLSLTRSDTEAIARTADLLACDAASAELVMHSPLQQLLPSAAAMTRKRIAGIERMRDRLAGEAGSGAAGA